jgi:hypothetical protein
VVRGSIHRDYLPANWPRLLLGPFVITGTNGNRLCFGAKERCMPETERNSDTESNQTKYLQTTIGELRKVYGVDFAKGCDDSEKIAM